MLRLETSRAPKNLCARCVFALKEIVNPKTFMLIAVEIAAEQRATVAHSASYGSGRPRISKAPAGAEDNDATKIQLFRPSGAGMVLIIVFPRLTLWAIIARRYAAGICFGNRTPTAGAVGYYRAPLRGWKMIRLHTCPVSPGTGCRGPWSKPVRFLCVKNPCLSLSAFFGLTSDLRSPTSDLGPPFFSVSAFQHFSISGYGAGFT